MTTVVIPSASEIADRVLDAQDGVLSKKMDERTNTVLEKIVSELVHGSDRGDAGLAVQTFLANGDASLEYTYEWDDVYPAAVAGRVVRALQHQGYSVAWRIYEMLREDDDNDSWRDMDAKEMATLQGYEDAFKKHADLSVDALELRVSLPDELVKEREEARAVASATTTASTRKRKRGTVAKKQKKKKPTKR
jgi:hypothetical protein